MFIDQCICVNIIMTKSFKLLTLAGGHKIARAPTDIYMLHWLLRYLVVGGNEALQQTCEVDIL